MADVLKETSPTGTADLGGTDTVRAGVSFTLGSYFEKLVLTGAAGIAGNGNALANTLTGNGAANALCGYAGNDVVSGGAGADTIDGGRGADRLTGGTGNDRFVFSAATHSGTSTTRDTITDFVRGQDRIDLRAIDANVGASGDQAFGKLVGATTAFTAPGQLRLAGGVLYGNTDADAQAEFSIALTGVSTVALSDFLL